MSSTAYNLREMLWEYPDKILRLFSSTRPIGYVIISCVLAVAMFSYLAKLDPSTVYMFEEKNRSVYREAVVGDVITLNPIYINQNFVDRDLHQLIFEKLLYISPDGGAEPAIAESWQLEEDGKQLRVTVSDKYYWHDGQKVTVDDVLFTMQRAIELSGNSRFDTFGNSLIGVTLSKIDDRTFTISLDSYSSTLLEVLSFYVLPKHLMEELSEDEFFTYGLIVPPVGSGMYRAESVKPDHIVLKLNENYPFRKQKPSINRIEYLMLSSVDDIKVRYMNREIDAISAIEMNEYKFLSEFKPNIYSMNLKNRKKLLYFNLNKDITKNLDIRKAISYSLDRNELLREGSIDGKAVSSSIVSDSWALNTVDQYYKYDPEQVSKVLSNAGYSKDEGEKYYKDKDSNEFTLELTYHANPKNKQLAEVFVKSMAKSGIKISTQPVEYGRLVNEILATRDFELLLLEVETSIDPDQYNLWHSTKKQYPDLNVSGYEYSRVDILLERARTSQDTDARKADYLQFQKYLSQDAPALVLYEPQFRFAANSYVKGIKTEGYIYPHERYRGISEWTLER